MGDPKSFKIAIVDDDASLCQAMERLLRAAGYQSCSYLTAEAFLQNRGSVSPDCILLDIQLGGMSGFDLQRLLAASGTTTPVIFITAYDDPETRKKALQTGCMAFLRKNDSSEAVLDAIRRACSSRKVKA